MFNQTFSTPFKAEQLLYANKWNKACSVLVWYKQWICGECVLRVERSTHPVPHLWRGLTIYLWEWGRRADILIDLIHAHTYTVQHPHGFDIRMLGLIFHIDEVQIKKKWEVRTESWTIPDPQYTQPHEDAHDLYIILHPLFVSHIQSNTECLHNQWK